MQRDPRPACARAVALWHLFPVLYRRVTSFYHTDIPCNFLFPVYFPSLSRFIRSPVSPLSHRSCPIQLTFILSRSRCAELCISEGVKRHNAAILLGASSKFAEVRMAVGSYPRGPLSDLSPIITGKQGNIPFPSRWKRGEAKKKKKTGEDITALEIHISSPTRTLQLRNVCHII